VPDDEAPEFLPDFEPLPPEIRPPQENIDLFWPAENEHTVKAGAALAEKSAAQPPATPPARRTSRRKIKK
jgi:hypothetical protein